MKKIKLIFALMVLLLGFTVIDCATAKINYEELIIAPDPDNPFQGTWITNVLSITYIHVINGMKGEWYFYNMKAGRWEKRASYTIVPNNDGFVTSTNWNISVTSSSDGDILTVVNDKYKRYVNK
jgi:hypothetical protein